MKLTTRIATRCLIALGALSLTFSCATVPPDKSTADWLVVLPDDVSYYLYLNTKNTRWLLQNIVRKSPFYSADLERVVDMTDRVYAGIKIRQGQSPEVNLVLIGSYPVFINSAFGWNKEWEPVKGETPYWRHTKSGIEAAAPESYIILISHGRMPEMIRAFRGGTRAALKLKVVQELDQNDLTLLFPLGIDESVSQDLGLPARKKIIEQVWIGGRKKEEHYVFQGAFYLAPDVDSDSFRKLLQILMLSLLRQEHMTGIGERLSAMTYQAQDRLVTVSDFFLTKEEFESFAESLLGGGL
ncbi:MAG TPA: hypothetical protein ENN69_00565 [Spirochaetia bacterium]|nr:hypothetical protein [Spirochaetia bacterium]